LNYDKVNSQMKLGLPFFVILMLLSVSGATLTVQSAEPGSAPSPAGRPQIDRKKMALADRPNLTLEDVRHTDRHRPARNSDDGGTQHCRI
jgi:hypothetical protein